MGAPEQRFGPNTTGDDRLPKLEALTEAQRWLLREGARHPALVRGLTNPRTGAGSRAETLGGKLHPALWAAFVLSGDWR